MYTAIDRIIKADYAIDSNLMIVMAIIGCLTNITMIIVLSYNQKSHRKFMMPKIFSADSTNDKIDLMVSNNINIRAAFIHVIGDLIQSFGVLLAAVIIYFNPTLKIADPICTICFSLIVVCTTIPIIVDIIYVFAEAFPRHLNYEALVSKLSAVEGVNEVHDLKVWHLGIDSYALNTHIRIDKNFKSLDTIDALYRACHASLLQFNRFEHINIQFELTDFLEQTQQELTGYFTPFKDVNKNLSADSSEEIE